MRATLIALGGIAAVLTAQETRHTPSPTMKSHQATVLGRKLVLVMPPEWVEVEGGSSIVPEAWRHSVSWKHPTIAGFMVHLFGAEEEGITPRSAIQKLLDSTDSAKLLSTLSVAVAGGAMKGHDVELELGQGKAISYYWLRALGAASDQVFVLMAEATRIREVDFEVVTRTAGFILDRFLRPGVEDRWQRDPMITLTRGSFVTRLATPSGWTYTRGPNSSLFWKGSAPGEFVAFYFDLPELTRLFSPESRFKTALGTEEALATMGGRLLSKTAIPGHVKAKELVCVLPPYSDEEQAEWIRYRVFLNEGVVVNLQAVIPVKDLDSVPPDTTQKLVDSVMTSITFGDAIPK